jgi:hypothetical protein
MMMKLTSKSHIDVRRPELMMTANKNMSIYSSADIAATPLKAAVAFT